MYLVSVYQSQSMVEASLGGRMTAEEMEVFSDELRNVAKSFGGRPYQVVLDYSKASSFDRETMDVLSEIKDECLTAGVSKIVSVVSDEHEMIRHTSTRLQMVLEGREEFTMEFERPSLAQQPGEKRLAA